MAPPVPASRRQRAADWLAVQEALERILAAVHPLSPECVPLLDALGRTLARSVVSPIDQPPWDNSAMDGFAVLAADVRGACAERPVVLRVIEDVHAGAFPTRPLGPGEAVKVMTGAPVPQGADSVVRLEHTSAWGDAAGASPGSEPAGDEAATGSGPGARPATGSGPVADAATGSALAAGVRLGDQVSIFRDDDAGRNVRRRGEDIRAGTSVLEAGRVLRPAEVGVLATVGQAEVAVHRRPRVAILSNGDELAALDAFDEVRAGRKIVNSNSYALAGAVQATGGVPRLLGIARDDEASIRSHLEGARDADVLITTAGASVGEHDFVKDVLEDMGFRLDFWRVKMKPGSPVSFGRLQTEGPSSGTAVPVFNLPGNPVSALVTFEVLVRPALRRLQGRLAVHPPTVRVRTAERVRAGPGLTHFLRVTLTPADDGIPVARSTGPQGSGILTSMAKADALLIVPEASDGVDAGALALAVLLGGPGDGRSQVGDSLPT